MDDEAAAVQGRPAKKKPKRVGASTFANPPDDTKINVEYSSCTGQVFSVSRFHVLTLSLTDAECY